MIRAKTAQIVPTAVWAVLAVVSAIVFPEALLYREINVDLVWQRNLGDYVLAHHALPQFVDRSFAAPHAAWVPQEWAFGIFVTIAERFHAWPVFAAAIVAMVYLALAVTAYRALLRGAEPFAVTICTGFCAVVLFGDFGVRDQVACWLPFSLLLLFLEIGGGAIWWCLPIVVIWANLHASVILAPVLIAIAAIGSAIDDRGFSERARSGAALTGLSLFAICCTPLGISLYRYAIELERGFMRSMISEWQPPLFDFPLMYFGMLPILIAVLARGFGPVRRTTDLGWFVLLALAGLDALRHVPLFALAAAPMAAIALTPPRFRRTVAPISLRSGKSLAVAAAAGSLWFIGALIVGDTLLLPRYARGTAPIVPEALVERIGTLPGERRVFCGDWGWCTPLLEDKNALVFMDSRTDPYPRSVWDDAERIGELEPSWKAILRRYDVNTLLLDSKSALAEFAENSGEWVRAQSSGTFIVLVKSSRNKKE